MAVSDSLAMYGQSQTPSVNIRVEDYATLVKRIAHHMMVRMPACVQVEDLIQAGMIGLLEAAQKYDASRGASFETYAGIRIRGAIVDEMRKGDWVPRSVHRNNRRISDAINTVESREGRDASDQEIAAELDMTLDEYYNVLKDNASSRLFSFEEAFGGEDTRMSSEHTSMAFIAPHDNMQREGLKESLAKAIADLPERERMILALYYDEELNLKEIGQIIGVSESRVSQIHSQATARLRTKLSDWQKNGAS
ncbi:RNA polymerase sigma factor FliA [Pseudoteredinibacter isoporae]|uniref:RNA polymerase sigma factor FliA n=2 Tax=Pseudoteredinibacter isoporae TaxID=570281 RepID=A0A7X0MXQ2_9GAMM|nr:RNA polymerase sigma factor FliA [Pseudoteredinibacter isoporae]MBB6523455.1 RNA polymerase sigma factor for flagellar operon FliA [Pseudoteredinibacter isoporae]NHO88964.1 RNA polymerase sigma factor FliA [Pseudoteredinibacter isoporae]NIB24328.1 RNA polymerase sigma factor FliA [Pseudoteredinibacter isoporae]